MDHGVEAVRQVGGKPLHGGRVGQVGDEHGRAGHVGAEVVGALARARDQDQVVAALEETVGEDGPDPGAGAGHQVGGHQRGPRGRASPASGVVGWFIG